MTVRRLVRWGCLVPSKSVRSALLHPRAEGNLRCHQQQTKASYPVAVGVRVEMECPGYVRTVANLQPNPFRHHEHPGAKDSLPLDRRLLTGSPSAKPPTQTPPPL
mmetsp:Transcript_100858/g.170581  ORF Transcript_100858/g.170581 Transcript_100858/m.170581 type:complete len:105 (-) Transcript_100858:59-373(-)